MFLVNALDKYHGRKATQNKDSTLSGRPELICFETGGTHIAVALAFSARVISFFWPSAISPFKESASKVADATVSCRTCNSACDCYSVRNYCDPKMIAIPQ
jgi:hypothetical protein